MGKQALGLRIVPPVDGYVAQVAERAALPPPIPNLLVDPKGLLEIGPGLRRALFGPGDDAQAVDGGCLAATIPDLAADPQRLPVVAPGASVVSQVPANNAQAAMTVRFELQPASSGTLHRVSRAAVAVVCNQRRSRAIARHAWSSSDEGQGLLKSGAGGMIVPSAKKRLTPAQVSRRFIVGCQAQRAAFLASGQSNGSPRRVGGCCVVAGDPGIVGLAQHHLCPVPAICQDPGKILQGREILLLEVPVSKAMVCPFACQ